MTPPHADQPDPRRAAPPDAHAGPAPDPGAHPLAGPLAPLAAALVAAASLLLLALAPPGAAPKPIGPADARLDVNAASPHHLALLPGIGPARADAIVAHRSAHGPFREPADLDAVHGVGPRTVERVAPFIRFGPPDASAPTIAP